MFESCCEKSNYKMSTTQNVMLRVAIVLGMLVAVVAILYFTPIPEGHFKSCDRPCHDLDWPMVCRVKIEIEDNFRDCENCPLNKTSSVTVNGKIPSPDIQICQNDILVVDVTNKIAGHSLTVHWRGQPNSEFPFMDGVPLVTQCPISSYTTFQYKFRASSAGTHYYHAFSGEDSFGGALIVRRPSKSEELGKYYDEDSRNHVIFISESPQGLLINGKGPSATGSALSIFNVKRNARYRFRVAYAGGKSGCPASLSIDDHLIRIIALDGSPINPIEAKSVDLSKGERVDFVLNANRDLNGYFLRVKACSGDGLGLINYEGSRKKRDDGKVRKDERRFDTALCESQIGRICLEGVKSLLKIPEKLKKEVEKVMFLSFGPKIRTINREFSSTLYAINNLTFSYPSSPLLTQLGQIPLSSVCDEVNVPEKCERGDICECVHVEYIPLGSSTEIILINQDSADEEHIFHLHGYRFYVVGFRQFDNVPRTDEIKLLDKENVLFKRNFNNPILKDTIRVPRNGVVALRFLANNPGFWMLRDEKAKGWTRGMDIVFQVGDSTQMVSPPSDFPTCGNYIGPDFFLM